MAEAPLEAGAVPSSAPDAATTSEGPSTGGGGSSSTPPDGGPAPADQCYVGLIEPPTTLAPSDERYVSFVRNGDFVYGASAEITGKGYRLMSIAIASGETRASEPLWPDTVAQMLRFAVSGDTAAFVTMQPENDDTYRQSCRVALYDTSEDAAVLAPTRFSDEPAGDSVENEVAWCGLESTEQGFVLAWNAYTDSMSDEQTLFAQRIGLDGEAIGDRIVLARGDKLTAEVTSASDGQRALFAVADATATQFTLVDTDTVAPFVVDDAVNNLLAGEPPQMWFVPDGVLMQTTSQLILVGADGKLKAGPVAARQLIAPFDQGYVVVERDSESGSSVMQKLDSDLDERGGASGLSPTWSIGPTALLASRDGTDVQMVFSESGEQRIGTLGCLEEPIAVGPQTCRETSEPTGLAAPLDLGCDAPVCYFTLRMEATSLAIGGYSVAEGTASPVNAEQAQVLAVDALSGFESAQWSEPDPVQEAQAGLFTVNAPALDLGWFALVGQESGTVVAAGGIVWAGNGGYWLPPSWRDPSVIECGSLPAMPAATFVDRRECATGDEQPALASPDDALDVALRSNIAAHAATFSEFDAFVYLYTPSVGECSNGAAEYVVVLTARNLAQ